ncbi:hypothetical protein [Streptomyces sp. NPDC055607]
MEDKTVQDVLIEDLLEVSDDSEDLKILEFMKNNGVPLTQQQAIGAFQLQQMGLSELANYVLAVRPSMTPVNRYYKMTEKRTLGDRIKGNMKLSSLLKANQQQASAQGVPMGISQGVK